MKDTIIRISMVCIAFVVFTIGGAAYAEGPIFAESEEEIKRALTAVRYRGIAGIEEGRTEPRAVVPIQFVFAKTELTAESKPLIRELGKALSSEELMGNRFRIEGHTDWMGSEEYNLLLSKARAITVRDYLIEKWNLPTQNLTVSGLGESKPIASNETDAGRARNRRVEVVREFD